MFELNELNIFQKFCDNRVNYEEFKVMMMETYEVESYIEPLWSSFTQNPVRFITSRGETKLFEQIISTIEKIGYKG